MGTQILRSGCGVAEFSGTYGKTKDVLMRYVESLNGKCNNHIGITNAHVFVVMSMTNENCFDICEYVAEHKLGTAIKTETIKNNNHYGWHEYKGTPIFAVLFTPDFKALEKWYQQFEPEFKLK